MDYIEGRFEEILNEFVSINRLNDVTKTNLYLALIEAHNLGIERAADNAEVEMERGNPYDPESEYAIVDRNSILNLKL